MFRKVTGLVVMVTFLSLASGSTGCNRKAKIKKFCKRMSECSDELAVAALKGKNVPEATLNIIKKQMKKQFGDVAKCEKKFEGKALKDKGEKCLKKSGCKAFAECVMSAAKK